MPSNCGADQTANDLLPILLGDKSFPLPDVNLDDPLYQLPPGTGVIYDPVPHITLEDLTTGVVGGTGVFDKLMTTHSAHLKKEYEANRISGAEYTKAYIEMTGAAMSAAVQFLMNRDQAYWAAIIAQATAQKNQVEVIAARVQLATVKVQLQLASYQALTAETEYALAKMKLATEDAQYCLIKAQTAQITYSTTQILPIQKALTQEQLEVQRAQTINTRSDGSPIEGTAGKQRELYDQQITSYKRDAENKFLKIVSDAWITQKTMDEGTLPPDGFNNASLNDLLTKTKANLGLA